MKTVCINDNSRENKNKFIDIATLTEKIANKSFEQLERKGVLIFPASISGYNDINKEQMILQSLDDLYIAGNIMGFIGYGDEQLVIKSRFSNDNDYFLHYLLSKVLDIPNIIDLKTNSEHNDGLFNMLVFLFPYYLKNAIRKGLFKTYISHNYNDTNLKGKIDVNRHIRQNIPFVGRIAYSQREYSSDNEMMELVRHTIEFIKKKNYGNSILSKIKDEVRLVIDATPTFEQCDKRKIVAKNKRIRIQHAYYYEYCMLQQLCLLILQHQKQSFGSDTKQIYGVLFDGAWLWEEYVNTIVKDYFYHPMNKGRKGAQRLFSGNNGLIYPDFIGRDSEFRIIADAKYKPSNNVGNKDYLQMLAYMFRFEAKKGYFIYPEINSVDDSQFWMNRGNTFENNVEARDDICVIKHGLKIHTEADNYESFVAKMQDYELEFKRKIAKY